MEGVWIKVEELEKLKQQRDELQSRYDWLAALFERKWNGVVGSGCQYTYSLVGNWRHSVSPLLGESLGEAIDAFNKWENEE